MNDPRPIAAAAPYTFEMPHELELAALKPGDHVKAIFEQVEDVEDQGAERMWVLIERIEDGQVFGILDNEPAGLTLIEAGMPVAVPLTHVISTSFSKGNQRPQTPPRREYWDRCMVDSCVLAGRSHADYLYREEPDMTREGDEYKDSGWRIRGTDDAIADDQARDEKPQYVALGAVLNRDDRWIHLIDSSWPCAFSWDKKAQDYLELERE